MVPILDGLRRSAIGQFSPGIFNVTQADGTLVINRPAKAGDVIVAYANGMGPVSNTPASGAVSPGGGSLAVCQQLPSATIGGIPARVEFAGLVPGFVGEYQVNITVPAGVAAGSAPLIITAGGIDSQAFPLATQ